jgi:hypothetical protein
MRIGGEMAFESVFVTTLFRTHLAVEFEFLKAFGLHAVGNVFDTALFGFWHGFRVM